VTSRAVQTESAAEEGTFLLEPVLQDAMAQAVFDLVGGLEVVSRDIASISCSLGRA
jgi:hypothetical protein